MGSSLFSFPSNSAPSRTVHSNKQTSLSLTKFLPATNEDIKMVLSQDSTHLQHGLNFPTQRCNWFSQFHFHFSHQLIDYWTNCEYGKIFRLWLQINPYSTFCENPLTTFELSRKQTKNKQTHCAENSTTAKSGKRNQTAT